MSEDTRRQVLAHLHTALRELTEASRLDTHDELNWETSDSMDIAFDAIKRLTRAAGKEPQSD